jgi:branched-chain amino acid transport system ATP-binding protein
VLGVEDLRVWYHKAEAVKGLSFQVAEGEIVGMLGPNGAGKSTTLRAISGLVAKCSGRIVFRERMISGLEPHEIARLGLIHALEGRRLFPRLTVEENLRAGAYASREDFSASIAEVFELFPRLKERRQQFAGTLSGGEQQMLNIGRALMAAPRLLMLDEPSWGLAPLIVKEIGRSIVEINRRRGLTILLVEQNARLALAISRRAYVMENGRITVSGPAEDLRRNPQVTEAYVGGAAG